MKIALLTLVFITAGMARPPRAVSDDEVNLVGARDRIDRIETLHNEMEALRRELLAEERAALKTLRKCDEYLDRFLRTRPETRTKEQTDIATSLEMLKTRAIGVIRGHKGMEYIYDNLFYCPAVPQRNKPGLFAGFPCADLLSRTDELSAVRAVIRLAHDSELTQEEKVFCARFLYHVAKNPDRKNALGRNLLLKEIEDLMARIETAKKANAPLWAVRPLERDLERLDQNVQEILICYDRILEDNNLAMQEFGTVIANMAKARRMKWGARK